MWLKSLTVIILVCASCYSVASDYSDAVNKITQLISDKRFEEAFQQSQNFNQYLGEIEFDFVTGIAALRAKRPHEAVFAFERVVNLKPKWHEARLHLASAYLLANNLPAAQSELNFLEKQNGLSEPLLKNMQILTNAIDNKIKKNGKSLTHLLSVTAGFDSNVNAGTTEDSIFIPSIGVDIPLSSQSQQTRSGYTTASYTGRYSQQLTQKQKFEVLGNVNSYFYLPEDEYNRTSMALIGKYAYEHKKQTYFVRASVTPLWIGADLYRTSSGFDFGIDYKYTKDLTLGAEIKVGTISNKFDERLDLDNLGASISILYVHQGLVHKFTGSILDQESTLQSANYNSKRTHSLNYQLLTQLMDKLTLAGSLGYSKIKHQEPHPLFKVQRDDSSFVLDSSLLYQFNKQAKFIAKLAFYNKYSDIPIYEYDRADVSLSYVMSF